MEGVIQKEGKELNFPLKPFVSDKTKQFIRKCLSYIPHDRFSIGDAYNAISQDQ